MRFKRHSDLSGRHSFLSPSSYAWLRYDEDKIARKFLTHLASIRGTQEHAFAQQAIELGMRMPDTPKAINQYINNCIGWRMTPEQPLYYSDNCFGHADALGYRDGVLRISDYKSGRSKTSMDQLKIYAAIFFLEYDMDPYESTIELRIYQSKNVRLEVPEPEEIFFIMRHIIAADKIVTQMRQEAEA